MTDLHESPGAPPKFEAMSETDKLARTVRYLILGVVGFVLILLYARGMAEKPLDRDAIYKACMATTPGAYTSFDAITVCVDKANAAK